MAAEAVADGEKAEFSSQIPWRRTGPGEFGLRKAFLRKKLRSMQDFSAAWLDLSSKFATFSRPADG